MTTKFDHKPSLLLFTNFRNFSKPSIEDVYEHNALQVSYEHKGKLKGVVFFDGSKNQLYISDCFANAATKKIIRDTGIKPERKMRSIVLSCIKEHLKEHHYVEQLNRSSVINVWTLDNFLEILNRTEFKKYLKPKMSFRLPNTNDGQANQCQRQSPRSRRSRARSRTADNACRSRDIAGR